MNYLTLEEIKKHLNIDSEFTDDDAYIESLGDVAEEIVSRHLNSDLELIAYDNEDKLPAPIKQACLLLIGDFYQNRENNVFTSVTELPHSYEYLLSMYRDYTNNNA